MIKIGDVFEIPLSMGKKGYGQYIFLDKKFGPLIMVFDLITVSQPPLNKFSMIESLFPPIITGVFAATKTGLWKIVANVPVREFKYPGFVSTHYDQNIGKARIWFFWDGEKYIKLGTVLPENLKHLEYLIVWNPPDVALRIERGYYPFPYRELIEKNEFQPIRHLEG